MEGEIGAQESEGMLTHIRILPADKQCYFCIITLLVHGQGYHSGEGAGGKDSEEGQRC